MSNELKPCPFCGGAAYFFKIVDEESSDFGGEGIVCTSCNASTGLRFACGDEVKPKLAETWNRRPDTRAMGASVVTDEAYKLLTYIAHHPLPLSSDDLRKRALALLAAPQPSAKALTDEQMESALESCPWARQVESRNAFRSGWRAALLAQPELPAASTQEDGEGQPSASVQQALVCKGAPELGTACGKCSRCLAAPLRPFQHRCGKCGGTYSARHGKGICATCRIRPQPSAKALTDEDRKAIAYAASCLDYSCRTEVNGYHCDFVDRLRALATLAAEQPSEDKRDAPAKGFVPVSERRLGEDGYCIGCDCQDDELDPCGTAVRQDEERRAAIAKGEGK